MLIFSYISRLNFLKTDILKKISKGKATEEFNISAQEFIL